VKKRLEKNWGVSTLDERESWSMEDWGFVQAYPEGMYSYEDFES